MAYKTRIDGNEYKFQRSGLFGTGTRIKVYLNGNLIEDEEFEDLMPTGEASLLSGDSKDYFETMCNIWANADNTRRKLNLGGSTRI